MPCRRHEVTFDLFGHFQCVLYEAVQAVFVHFGAVSFCWPSFLSFAFHVHIIPTIDCRFYYN